MVGAVTRTFCSFCVLCEGLAHLTLPDSLCCASNSAFSGERPRGGVQSGGQQGAPLPDKNSFFFFSFPQYQHSTNITQSLSCPFKLIWLKIGPQKHFALCSQLPGHTCLTSSSTSLFPASITLAAKWSPFT